MKFRIALSAIVLPTLLLFACNSDKKYTQITDWYEDTRAAILEQSARTTDDADIRFTTDSSEIEITYYNAGKPIKKEWKNIDDVVRHRMLYAEDTNFTLVTEYCNNGSLAYEGIEYKRKPYGLATWYYCENGKIFEQGLRYKFVKMGSWKRYDTSGKVILEHEYKKKIKFKDFPEME